MEIRIKKINNLKNKILKLYIIMALIAFTFFIVFSISLEKISSLYCLVMAISYLIIYFISKRIYLTWLGKLQYIFFLLPFFLANYISTTDIYINDYVYDLNNILIKVMSTQEEKKYIITQNEIVDNNHKIIFHWNSDDFNVLIEKGEIEVKEKNISYKIEIKSKKHYNNYCILKNIKEKKYKIYKGKCNEHKLQIIRSKKV